MSNSLGRAVVFGLAALYDIADDAEKAPVAPSLGLRALLAFLHQACRQHDRAPFDQFWKEVTDPGNPELHELDRNYSRAYRARQQIAAIAQRFKLDPGGQAYRDFFQQLRENQRCAVDPDFRARIQAKAFLDEYRLKPRGVTMDEWRMMQSLDTGEKPRW